MRSAARNLLFGGKLLNQPLERTGGGKKWEGAVETFPRQLATMLFTQQHGAESSVLAQAECDAVEGAGSSGGCCRDDGAEFIAADR